jgi:hypothetical protein
MVHADEGLTVLRFRQRLQLQSSTGTQSEYMGIPWRPLSQQDGGHSVKARQSAARTAAVLPRIAPRLPDRNLL